MELGFDHQDLLGSTAPPASTSAADARLDWASIRARFIAAHALRLELANARDRETAGGSFTVAGGQVLAFERQISLAVNPTALVKGKDLFAYNGTCTGTHKPAVEE